MHTPREQLILCSHLYRICLHPKCNEKDKSWAAGTASLAAAAASTDAVLIYARTGAIVTALAAAHFIFAVVAQTNAVVAAAGAVASANRSCVHAAKCAAKAAAKAAAAVAHRACGWVWGTGGAVAMVEAAVITATIVWAARCRFAFQQEIRAKSIIFAIVVQMLFLASFYCVSGV